MDWYSQTIRAVLFAAAVVVFVLAAVVPERRVQLIAMGLAVATAVFFLDALDAA